MGLRLVFNIIQTHSAYVALFSLYSTRVGQFVDYHRKLPIRFPVPMAKWTLKTEFTFDAAHSIKDYDGPCGRLHGHTYRVRMEAAASKLHSSEYCPHEVMEEEE